MDQSAARESWRGREVLRLLDLVCSERHYLREIIASLPVPVAILAGSGEVLSSNRRFREFFRQGEPGLNAADLLKSPDLRSALEKVVGRDPATSDLSDQLHIGKLRITLTPVRGWGDAADQEVLLTVATIEEGRVASPEEAPDLPAVLWSLNPETSRFISIAGDCEALFGAPREHWLEEQNHWSERVHPAEREAVIQFYRQSVAAGTDFTCEYRTASGKKEQWSRDFVRVLGVPGGQSRLSGITVDATGRRKTDEQAIQANRIDALIRLSRRLSHDLNNALMIITGYGEELLSQFAEQDSRRSDVQALLSAAETIAGIAGELQGFTRPQSGPGSPVAVGEVLSAVSERIRAQLGAVLVTRLLEGPLSASAAAAQLEAVLMSIARALRHSADPHMILTAGRRRVSDYKEGAFGPQPGDYVEIVFRAPLDSALEPHAFETLLAGRDPHGADLARAYAIIRDWGGWISAARTEHNSEVRILLKASTPEAPLEVPESRSGPEPPALATGSVRTVLVVEDETGIRSLVRRILDREGYRVLEASTAAEADEAVRRSATKIDLLITDVGLPGESGPEMAERLSTVLPQMRVLYMSGFADPSELPPAVAASTQAFLRKPFTRSALVKKVREAISPEKS